MLKDIDERVELELGTYRRMLVTMLSFFPSLYSYIFPPFFPGIISAIMSLNVDVKRNYELTVIAQDRGVATKKGYFDNTESSLSMAQVSIVVRRVNRNAPLIGVQPSLPSLFMESHPDVIALVQVTDADAGMHGQISQVDAVDTDERRSNATGLFFYVTESGTVAGQYYIRMPRNYDRDGHAESVRLTLTAVDRGIPPKAASKNVRIEMKWKGSDCTFQKQSCKTQLVSTGK